MDDLTPYERRLVLGALWRFRSATAEGLSADGALTADDAVHEIDFVDAMDSAARKLGGDPAEHLYGAPRY